MEAAKVSTKLFKNAPKNIKSFVLGALQTNCYSFLDSMEHKNLFKRCQKNRNNL